MRWLSTVRADQADWLAAQRRSPDCLTRLEPSGVRLQRRSKEGQESAALLFGREHRAVLAGLQSSRLVANGVVSVPDWHEIA